jgi:hypothetical protein
LALHLKVYIIKKGLSTEAFREIGKLYHVGIPSL